MKYSLWFLTTFSVACFGQSDPQTRAEEIEQQRQQKAAHVTPDVPGRVEKAFDYVANNELLERITGQIPGLRVIFGGFPAGSGFGGGLQYLRRDLLNSNVTFRTSARISTKLYQNYDTELVLPHLLSDHALLGVSSGYQNLASVNYYGPGPNSSKSSRSDYRLETTSFGGTAAVKPFPHFSVGGTGSYLLFNVGPGQEDDFVSSDQVFSPVQAPGIRQQTNFVQGGPFAEFDTRDSGNAARSGGYYAARYLYYSDREFDRYNFRRFEAEAIHYIPLFHRQRLIVVRGKTSLSYTDGGQVVPFYLQSVVGGSDDLRGFRQYRFYDNDSIVLNGEYRWTIFTGLDGAVFVDEAKVFPTAAQWNLHHLEHSYGFGFRAYNQSSTFFRVDVGFSREGFEVWAKFSDIF